VTYKPAEIRVAIIIAALVLTGCGQAETSAVYDCSAKNGTAVFENGHYKSCSIPDRGGKQ
jgi:uncharacterized lipoprotein YehR (DUF1307 family)